MKHLLEGIIIHKVPFQDRHVVATILMRSGKLASVLFYGGQGGGKKKKASIIDLGHMIKVNFSVGKYGNEMLQAKECSEIWIPSNIRENFEAYSLMCFYFELVRKISLAENFHDKNREADLTLEGIFRVLSNALNSMDTALKNGSFHCGSQLFTFLVKLSLDQGVLPARDECMLTGESFEPLEERVLSHHHGGFLKTTILSNEAKATPGALDISLGIYNGMNQVLTSKYGDLNDFELKTSSLNNDKLVAKEYLDYFFHQFQFSFSQFKSLDLLF